MDCFSKPGYSITVLIPTAIHSQLLSPTLFHFQPTPIYFHSFLALSQ